MVMAHNVMMTAMIPFNSKLGLVLLLLGKYYYVYKSTYNTRTGVVCIKIK